MNYYNSYDIDMLAGPPAPSPGVGAAPGWVRTSSWTIGVLAVHIHGVFHALEVHVYIYIYV